MASPSSRSAVLQWLSFIDQCTPASTVPTAALLPKRKRDESDESEDSANDHDHDDNENYNCGCDSPAPGPAALGDGLPTPSPSISVTPKVPSASMPERSATTPVKKRPRLYDPNDETTSQDADFTDIDQTPRGVPVSVPPSLSSGISNSASLPSDAGTARSRSMRSASSRTPSPTKQLKAMELHEHGFAVDKLVGGAASSLLPPELMQLVQDIDDLSTGFGAVPSSLQVEIQSSQQPALVDARLFRDQVFSSSSDLRSMPLDKVLRIVRRAHRCELRMEDEASWNMEVHHHVLRAVFRPRGREGLVDFVSCTTAKVSPHYRPRSAPSKMVDFCICINGALEEHEQATASTANKAKVQIDELRRVRAEQSINHTDYAALADMPIAVSIETKRGPENWSAAVLQMGTWQTAQLRSLSSLLLFQSPSDVPSIPPSPSPSSQPYINPPQMVLPAALSFLPGIIIQGHDWSFVVTLQVDAEHRPILLTKIAMGTTESVLGVYKILAVLSRLKRWAAAEYWPAFKKFALHME